MIAESVAGLALYIPIFVAIMLVVIEASHAFEIARHLSRGANLAARSLAQEYRKDPQVTTDGAKQQSMFDQIRIANVIASNEQFEIPAGGWQLTTSPPTVTVTLTYIGGVGQPPLPMFPAIDPLNLGKQFTIKSSATYRLQ